MAGGGLGQCRKATGLPWEDCSHSTLPLSPRQYASLKNEAIWFSWRVQWEIASRLCEFQERTQGACAERVSFPADQATSSCMDKRILFGGVKRHAAPSFVGRLQVTACRSWVQAQFHFRPMMDELTYIAIPDVVSGIRSDQRYAS